MYLTCKSPYRYKNTKSKPGKQLQQNITENLPKLSGESNVSAQHPYHFDHCTFVSISNRPLQHKERNVFEFTHVSHLPNDVIYYCCMALNNSPVSLKLAVVFLAL